MKRPRLKKRGAARCKVRDCQQRASRGGMCRDCHRAASGRRQKGKPVSSGNGNDLEPQTPPEPYDLYVDAFVHKGKYTMTMGVRTQCRCGQTIVVAGDQMSDALDQIEATGEFVGTCDRCRHPVRLLKRAVVSTAQHNAQMVATSGRGRVR